MTCHCDVTSPSQPVRRSISRQDLARATNRIAPAMHRDSATSLALCSRAHATRLALPHPSHCDDPTHSFSRHCDGPCHYIPDRLTASSQFAPMRPSLPLLPVFHHSDDPPCSLPVPGPCDEPCQINPDHCDVPTPAAPLRPANPTRSIATSPALPIHRDQPSPPSPVRSLATHLALPMRRPTPGHVKP